VTLVDEALEVQEPRQSCKTCTWLSSKNDNERGEWADLMDNPTIQTNSIFQIMVRRGYKGSYSTLSRHRNKSHDC